MTTKQPLDSTRGKQLKLGDAIAKIAKALHIPHCEKCEQRRLILNEIRALGVKETIKKLKAVGLSGSKEKPDSLRSRHDAGQPASLSLGGSDSEASGSWSVEEIVKKMEDCCDEK